MSLRSGRAVLLIGVLGCAAACDGPTLEIGERILPLSDAAVARDAAETSDSDASDASRRRDAEVDRRFCREEHDCVFNPVHQHCNLVTARCVDCVEDRNCMSGVCVLPEGQCVGDRGHDPNAPPSSSVP